MNNDTAQGQLVLSQDQYALIQDTTKGGVAVYAGPHSLSLSPNDKPVIYDTKQNAYRVVSVQEAIKQNPRVPEGHYLVLENPAFDQSGNLLHPEKGANTVAQLQTGRTINLPGPVTFPLWPGQTAKPVPGHHMRSNQYLVVRVYNADEANKNRPHAMEDGKFNNGQLIVIKGTDVPFFIPPTGFEVLPDQNSTAYVREALTLERLEYCVLKDEDGNKRYARGPEVVFPEATETFVINDEDNSRKFKMIELNTKMGLYIKVIADYTEPWRLLGQNEVPPLKHEGRNVVVEEGELRLQYKAGEELFITGKEQSIYCPRPEHALITYSDQASGKTRQRYYGIAIPRGEGRYILNKVTTGEVEMKKGPQIFLPDPREQVIVRRVLDDRTVKLWYPGNQEALHFNRKLRSMTVEGEDYLEAAVGASSSFDTSVMGATRSANLMYSSGGRFEGSELNRRATFTPPPTLTLNTKYDGVPSINVWTGYAIQIVNRTGGRKVVIGPASPLLEYDETLEVLELSTGKPKNTDNLKQDVYLRIDHNLVSDEVEVETRGPVPVKIKLSYRVNFLREHQERWFNVENYVKYLCDHMRSLLKASARKTDIREWIENSTEFIRTVVLGEKKEDGTPRSRFFSENGMEVYDVEVLGVEIADASIKTLISTAQKTAVEDAVRLSSAQAKLELTKVQVRVDEEISQLESSLVVKKEEHRRTSAEAKAVTTLKELALQVEHTMSKLKSDVDSQVHLDQVAKATLQRQIAQDEAAKVVLAAHTEMFERRMKAIAPDLVAAITVLGQTKFATDLSTALAPLALTQHQGLGQTVENVFRGTPLEQFINNMKTPLEAGRVS